MSKFVKRAVPLTCVVLLLSVTQVMGQSATPPLKIDSDVTSRKANVLTVGVRADARPFSYKTGIRADEPIMPGYGGYMVEICRRVLSEMQAKGPFANYRILVEEVDAATRFERLNTGQVDLLCGPESITLSRLHQYNTSHPLFLSGVTYVSANTEFFPQFTHCFAIIGMVEKTTAETQGLQHVADTGELLRFDPALKGYLNLRANPENSIENLDLHQVLTDVEKEIEEYRTGVSSRRSTGRDKIRPELIKTTECKTGFKEGPVVFYDSHSQGLQDLCAGRILFYMGDIDIINKRLDTMPKCDPVRRRATMTREAYGVYFRKTRGRPESDRFDSINVFDGVLYSEFNNILLRKMQDTENILDYEFKREFGDEVPTEDLKRFFESFKFASNY